MILAFPEGYETQLGDDRNALSGGQRQRLTLARAFYRQPKLLILDEPNANLDGVGEAALSRAIEAAKGWGATIFIIAHQMNLLRSTDRLLLLTAGRLVMFGERDKVLATIRSGRATPEPQAALPKSALIARKGPVAGQTQTRQPQRTPVAANIAAIAERPAASVSSFKDSETIPVPISITTVPAAGRATPWEDQTVAFHESLPVERLAQGQPQHRRQPTA